MKPSDLKALHLKAIQRNEQEVQSQFLDFIRRQLRFMAREFLKQGAAEFNDEEWLERMQDMLAPPIGNAYYEGAFSELAQFEQTKRTTASEAVDRYNLDVPDFIGTELPDWLVAAIEIELTETFAEPYWQAINDRTRRDVQTLVQAGIEQGWSTRRIAQQIQNLQGNYSRSRALAVARTETGRARNAGHAAGIAGLEQETGLQIGKQWLSILGNTTRTTHAALDGVTVPSAAGLFTLGGVEIPYPQHRSLPAEDSVNCSCTIISAIGLE